MAKKIIEIKNVSKSYGDAVIIEDLNLYINVENQNVLYNAVVKAAFAF